MTVAGTFSRRTWSLLLFGIAAALIVQMLVLSGIGGASTTTAISDIGGVIVIGTASAVTIRTAFTFGKDEQLRKQWLAIGLGIALYTLGDSVWTFIEVFQGKEPPFPGAPDLFYMSMYVFLGYGLVSAALAYRGLVKIKMPLIGAAVVTAASSFAIYFVLIKDILADPGVVLLEKAVDVFYPVGDMLLLLAPGVFIVLVVSQLGRGALAVPWRFVVMGIALLAVSDAVYQWLEWQSAYASGNIIDLGWMLGFVLLAVGASTMRDLIVPASRPA